jgi:hypothetical protein
MKFIALALVLTFSATDPSQGPGETYKSAKALPALQSCLTDKLARIGDVTDITVDGVTTLMIREGPGDPVMLIDLAPPSVTVTTNFLYGARKLVEACL